MRKISLQRLEAALNDCVKNKKPIPDAFSIWPACNASTTFSSIPSKGHRAGRAGRRVES